MWSFKKIPADDAKKIKIEADAVAILNAARFAADAILRRRAAMDRNGLQDQPLVVIAGEVHDRPSHHLHHMVMLKHLIEQEHVVMAGEYPHTSLTDAFNFVTGTKITPFGRSLLGTFDVTENLTAKSIIANTIYPQAITSRAVLMRMIVREKIPFCATDTSRHRPIFSLSRPHATFVDGRCSESTAASLQRCFNNAAYRPDTISPDGMAVRNHHMVTMGLDFARAWQARILIQQCGDHHIFGDGPNGQIRMADSLAKQYQARKTPYIAVPLYTNLPYETFMKKHNIQPGDALPTMVLPKEGFTCSPRTDPNFLERWLGWDHNSTMQKEMDYINPLLENMGMARETMNLAEYNVLIARYTADTLKAFQRVQQSPHNTI